MSKTVISDELRHSIYQHIRSHNKYMTNEVLDTFSPRKLICEVHPTYQEYYTKLIYPKINDNES